MEKIKTWGTRVDVKIDQLDIIEYLQQSLTIEIVRQIEAANGKPMGEPRIRITDEVYYDEETDKHYPFKRITAVCNFIEAGEW